MKSKRLIAFGLSSVMVLTLSVAAIPKTFAKAETAGVTMYRLYNPNSGEHLYTKEILERDSLSKTEWNYEGIGWIAPEKSNTPVYRLFNTITGDHHYTMYIEERDSLASLGWWNYEGIGWYSDDAKTVPLYREFNPGAVIGTHNYTTSKEEHDILVSGNWVDEGIGWYAISDGKTPPAKKPGDETLKIGDYVVLGAYEQDNDLTNGPEPIEWEYIGDKDGHKFLLSKYALDYKKYHDHEEDTKTIFWEECTLRSWLNNDFYNTAFSDSDKKWIVTSHNENPGTIELYRFDNIFGGWKDGNDTDDNVFLLSWTEARDYLDFNTNLEEANGNPKLICSPTAYVEGLIDPADLAYGINYQWFLRSQATSFHPMYFEKDGNVTASPANYERCIRPALLID